MFQEGLLTKPRVPRVIASDTCGVEIQKVQAKARNINAPPTDSEVKRKVGFFMPFVPFVVAWTISPISAQNDRNRKLKDKYSVAIEMSARNSGQV